MEMNATAKARNEDEWAGQREQQLSSLPLLLWFPAGHLVYAMAMAMAMAM
jgi:hypothetical protein